MSVVEAIVVGIVEGLTEFLPVSSTGHIMVAERMLGLESGAFVRAFTVLVQLGAILSVVCMYWRRFLGGWKFYGRLLLGFLPAGVMGLLLGGVLDGLLGSVWVVGVSLVVGGVLMLFVDRWFVGRDESVSGGQALVTGVFQCAALVPGVSRSMATIVGGLYAGLSRRQATEFSFLLAVPTLFAAGGYKAWELMRSPGGMEALRENWLVVLVGNVVAFAVGMGAIKGFMGVVSRYGFKGFGYYRIGVGMLVLMLLWR